MLVVEKNIKVGKLKRRR